MHPQLTDIEHEFDLARSQLDRLVERVPEEGWGRRPSPERWSAAECIAHLNLTARAFLPLLDAAIDEARRLPPPRSTRYRRDPIGWMLWRTMGPPVRFRIPTRAAFVPTGDAEPRRLVEEFRGLQDAQRRCVAAADGLALEDVRIASPFGERVRYNLFACLSILPRHELRHLWQAGRAVDAARRGATIAP